MNRNINDFRAKIDEIFEQIVADPRPCDIQCYGSGVKMANDPGDYMRYHMLVSLYPSPQKCIPILADWDNTVSEINEECNRLRERLILADIPVVEDSTTPSLPYGVELSIGIMAATGLPYYNVFGMRDYDLAVLAAIKCGGRFVEHDPAP